MTPSPYGALPATEVPSEEFSAADKTVLMPPSEPPALAPGVAKALLRLILNVAHAEPDTDHVSSDAHVLNLDKKAA